VENDLIAYTYTKLEKSKIIICQVYTNVYKYLSMVFKTVKTFTRSEGLHVLIHFTE
jgi:hypothetical protein